MPYVEDIHWIDRFGERLYMQMPDQMDHMRGRPYHPEEFYGWLMQFADGNRIDLHVESIAHAREEILKDKLCKVLLEKEQVLPPVSEASEEDHYVKRPDKAAFLCDCNNFW